MAPRGHGAQTNIEEGQEMATAKLDLKALAGSVSRSSAPLCEVAADHLTSAQLVDVVLSRSGDLRNIVDIIYSAIFGWISAVI
jgi:hypothetical protein